MKENLFRTRFVLPALGSLGAHVSQIESPLHAVGFPDLNVCVRGTEFNIELKAFKEEGRMKLRPSQVKWIFDRCKRGGVVFILTYVEGKNESSIVLHNGYDVLQLSAPQSIKSWLSSSVCVIPVIKRAEAQAIEGLASALRDRT